ncbi:hypothetical protein [Hyalangium rubrum]|uniref:Uncharacterized protein n=1 Tax=Hyalangium rubrum TaxID=3103134 RepID=A0ABU5HCW3_9BACT|nr:hypothetical protein [Hyalangium sp. s54d21]MDY7231305.1 hypothetical protein [Hyalangium sp. s54d21]
MGGEVRHILPLCGEPLQVRVSGEDGERLEGEIRMADEALGFRDIVLAAPILGGLEAGDEVGIAAGTGLLWNAVFTEGDPRAGSNAQGAELAMGRSGGGGTARDGEQSATEEQGFENTHEKNTPPARRRARHRVRMDREDTTTVSTHPGRLKDAASMWTRGFARNLPPTQAHGRRGLREHRSQLRHRDDQPGKRAGKTGGRASIPLLLPRSPGRIRMLRVLTATLGTAIGGERLGPGEGEGEHQHEQHMREAAHGVTESVTA